jgi:mannose-1-phosphate guanylyltransferase
MPKQLLPLAGATDEPLIAATLRRIEPIIPPDRVWIATSTRLVDATAAALPQVPRTNFLAEPVARNTAPCIALASAIIERIDPEAIVAVFPADHFIGDEPAFLRVFEEAVRLADDGWITTIGIVPTRPETGYGYIEVGEPLTLGGFAVSRFVEKPDRKRAESFVAGRRHLWNGGMFFFRAAVMRNAVSKLLPDLAVGVRRIEAAATAAERAEALAEVFPTLQSISIDHGVMEKADRMAVVPGSFGWNDVGSWQTTWEMSARDPSGNALPPDAIAVDARNNLVKDLTHGAVRKRWSLVGVDDLVIVETDDAVLVIPRERAQDVRIVVDLLASRGELDKL